MKPHDVIAPHVLAVDAADHRPKINVRFLQARPTDGALYGAAQTWSEAHTDWDWSQVLLTVRRQLMREFNGPLAAALVILANQRYDDVRAVVADALSRADPGFVLPKRVDDVTAAVMQAILFGAEGPGNG